ncbi:RNA polymerase II-associated protein 3 isoform X2 [Kryptolebias marmoratus]|uniref:RNA polymerase II-associated protein 3 isoform X2 n=1 Tax=Kryptolebias marmoratus TaxID=37003 RepID=UPI000D530EA0|nr:RNA polymerase II-associated protein 3 isoform X2 [Kryptolebias marmoratus]
MSRKKAIVKGGPPVPRIRENSRLMRTHESMLDFISGRNSAGSVLDALAPALFGLRYPESLEDDLIYTDDDNDDDNEYYPYCATKKHLEPHPQIKQLTDEEADKIAKELIEEEERRKGKTERNKRKKQRKKEKKRLEKENSPKENLLEVEKDKSDSSEDQDQKPISASNSEEIKCSKANQSQTASEVAAWKKHESTTDKDLIRVMKKDEDHQRGLSLNNSVTEEKCNQRFPNENNEDKTKVQKLEEEKPEVPEEPDFQKQGDEASEKKTVNPAVEEFAKRSIELACVGNRLAASGQYEMAASCFTDAIKYNPTEFKLFGNRSLCYERLQQYENALRDADVALSMEPNWIKGLFRKGKALCGLKRYYEASLIYKDVLKLENTSAEATQELKRAQTLHLMEMGFSWAQSLEALKTHATLEEAVEALFASDSSPGPKGAGAIWDNTKVQEWDDGDDSDEGEWIVQQLTRPRMQQSKDLDSLGQTRSESYSLTPHSSISRKPELFSVWVGTLAPTMTYLKLHELFSRAGTVCSIKMLLEQQCAFVNYTRKEDCERAIQCIDGMVVEGAPLTVRYPHKFHTGLSGSNFGATDPSPHPGTCKKECFFWRTIGCTREDCTFRHVPEHKNLDKDKFTSRLGYLSHVGDHK